MTDDDDDDDDGQDQVPATAALPQIGSSSLFAFDLFGGNGDEAAAPTPTAAAGVPPISKSANATQKPKGETMTSTFTTADTASLKTTTAGPKPPVRLHKPPGP